MPTKTKVHCSFYGLLNTNSDKHNCVLINSDVIVYKIYLPDYVSIIDDLSSFLDLKEIDRSKKYYKEIDKNRFIICRSLLKFVLSIHTKSDIKQIKLDYQKNKKPYLSSHPSVFFNVTHSEYYGLIAIANRAIGIDIEHIDKPYDVVNSLEHIYNDKEISLIQNAIDKNYTFHSIWTRKEAFVKALGKGIDDDFSKVPSIDGLHILDSSITKSKKNWKIQGFEITDNYIGAVAYEEKETCSEKIFIYALPNKINDLFELLS